MRVCVRSSIELLLSRQLSQRFLEWTDLQDLEALVLLRQPIRGVHFMASKIMQSVLSFYRCIPFGSISCGHIMIQTPALVAKALMRGESYIRAYADV